jgi:GNAT superfamily N-acetyltransferase
MMSSDQKSESLAVTIRHCLLADFPQVLSLLEQLWPTAELDPTGLEQCFCQAMAAENQFYLGAEVGQRLVGFGTLSIKYNLWAHGRLACIDELVVDAAYRGRGVGCQLLAFLELVARQRGAHRVELASAFHRQESHAWYRRRGYSELSIVFSKPLDQIPATTVHVGLRF